MKNILIRNLNKKTQNIINVLKEEYQIKTASKLVVLLIHQHLEIKIDNKKKTSDLFRTRSEVTKYQKFENDIKSIIHDDFEFQKLEDIKHHISNSIFELNKSEESDFY